MLIDRLLQFGLEGVYGSARGGSSGISGSGRARVCDKRLADLMPELGTFAGWLVLACSIVLLVIVVVGLVFVREHFLKEWMPAMIAGLILISIVPLANEIYWKRQKEFEKCVQDRDKRYELLGSTARTYTNIFKVHTQLHYFAAELSRYEQMMRGVRGKKPRRDGNYEKNLAMISALMAQRSELVMERIRLESQIAADSALMNRYFPSVAAEYNSVALSYDEQITVGAVFEPTRQHKLVKDVERVVGLLEKEARTLECK